jgi:hypothetical protein
MPGTGLTLLIVSSLAHKYAYAPDALVLLRARGERPRCCCAGS